MKNEELKPCPFCGGKAVMISYSEFAFIQCENCECRTPRIDANAQFCAKDRAIELWNRRADK